MISYECCNDCEDRKSAVCYRCNSKPHIAEFYNSDNGVRILNFGGEEFRVINVENYNGGKKFIAKIYSITRHFLCGNMASSVYNTEGLRKRIIVMIKFKKSDLFEGVL